MHRRKFLQSGTGAVAAGALLGGSSLVAASEKPEMAFEPAHASNYTNGSRRASDMRWIVVHTIEGSASSGINWFKNPNANVSSHFVVDEYGEITQMVDLQDVAWTQGNGPYNNTGISIEMSGYANSTDFTEAKYDAVAELCAWLCDTYDIPAQHPTFDIAPCSAYSGKGGLIGHDQVPSQYDCDEVTGGKVDPGSTWSWDYLLQKMDAPGGGGGSLSAGDAIRTTTTVNARTGPEVADNVVHTNPAGVRGVVKNGPQQADGYTWYKVGYENGIVGWTVEQFHDDASTTFLHDQRVATTADLNVHDDHKLGAPNVWIAPQGSGGYVRAGPQLDNGYTWWKVAFNSGLTGWCVAEYLESAPVEGHGVGHGDGGGGGGGGGDDGGDDGGNEPGTDFDIETDLTVPVDVTGQEIDDDIAAERPDSPLIGLGDDFVTAQEEYGVNAVYQAAHAIHESAWGTSTIAQDKQNLFGWGAEDSDPYNGAKYFETFEDCVDYVIGEVADLYLEPGNWRYNGPTLDGMNEYYATDDRWDVKIAGHYRTLAANI